MATARPAPAPAAQKELVLVAIAGDIGVGSETPIPQDQPLLVGRSARGLQLPDPLVSIQHAMIQYDPRRGLVVEDLGSATGTWVDEECVKKDSRPIGIGTRLRFGDTVFEVQSAWRLPRWLKWVALGAVGVAAIGFVLFVAQGFTAAPIPELSCPRPVVMGRMGRNTGAIPIPADFVRTRGLAPHAIRCEEVTDFDFDGRDELWLSLGDAGSAVVTFTDDLAWKVLGEFAPGCEQRKLAEGGPDNFPEIQCGGEHWLMVDGGYRLMAQEGVVVWYRAVSQKLAPEPAKAKTKGKAAPPPPGPPKLGIEVEAKEIEVGRFALKSTQLLGAFLSARGVGEPVHYVICEEAFDGIRAQALTVREQVVDLSVGCLSDLRLEGISAEPVAFALSPSGRAALVDDVVRFYAGSPDGLFLDPRFEALVAQMKRDPGYLKGAVKLIGDSKESGFAPLEPVPEPSSVVRSSHALVERDSRLVAAPVAVTATVVKEGLATFDPPGCADLVVQTEPFHSYGWGSLTGTTFVTVKDVGCQPRVLVSAGYGSGTFDAQLPGLDLRVVIDGGPSVRGLEVRRLRLAWRVP